MLTKYEAYRSNVSFFSFCICHLNGTRSLHQFHELLLWHDLVNTLGDVAVKLRRSCHRMRLGSDLEPSWGRLGAISEASWGLLGPSRGSLGTSSGALGASWALRTIILQSAWTSSRAHGRKYDKCNPLPWVFGERMVLESLLGGFGGPLGRLWGALWGLLGASGGV